MMWCIVGHRDRQCRFLQPHSHALLWNRLQVVVDLDTIPPVEVEVIVTQKNYSICPDSYIVLTSSTITKIMGFWCKVHTHQLGGPKLYGFSEIITSMGYDRFDCTYSIRH